MNVEEYFMHNFNERLQEVENQIERAELLGFKNTKQFQLGRFNIISTFNHRELDKDELVELKESIEKLLADKFLDKMKSFAKGQVEELKYLIKLAS